MKKALALALVLMSFAAMPVAAQPLSRTFSLTDHHTGMQITVGRAVRDTRGGQFAKPSLGKTFMVIYVRIFNGSNRAHDFNPLDLSLVDEHGQTWEGDAMIPSGYSPQIHSQTVPDHQVRAGWIGFEVPRSAKRLSVYWDDSYNLDPPGLVVTINT